MTVSHTLSAEAGHTKWCFAYRYGTLLAHYGPTTVRLRRRRLGYICYSKLISWFIVRLVGQFSIWVSLCVWCCCGEKYVIDIARRP